MKQLPENYKTRKLIAKLEQLGAIIEFEPQEEDISPSDTLGFEDNETACKRIEQDYNNGNIYAWFCAKVTVKYKGYEATDYIGCCSYKSEKDFKDNSGYYLNMVQTCVAEINRDINARNREIRRQFELRCARRIAVKYGFLVVKAVHEYPVTL